MSGLTPVRGELQEIASSLSLERIVGEALENNPELHAMRAQWEAMQERPVQERSLANPMFKYASMNTTDPYRFPDTEEKRYMVEQEFPWFGKLGLKGRMAEKDAESMHRGYETMQRDVVMMVKEAYFDLYGTQQTLTITRGEQLVLDDLVKVTESMYSTGQRSQQDVLKAQSEITMLKQKCLELEGQEAALKAKINQLLNRRVDSPLGLAVTAPEKDWSASSSNLLAWAVQARPEVKKARVEIQRSEYERAYMKKESLPDYRLGVEYRSFRTSDDMVMFTVGFDLPVWQKKYRAGVREADKMIESRQAALEAAMRQASYEVQDAWFKLQTARRTLELYQKELLPQAEARFAASEASYRTGKADFMDLLESERFRLSARMMTAMAEGRLGMQLARLERAVGAELTADGPKKEAK